MEFVNYPGSTGPEPNAESDAFWRAAKEGRFTLPCCTGCGRFHWHPRAFCPFCYADVEWRQASGAATVYSFSVVAGKSSSYCLAYVKLAEGPIMMTNIVGAPGEDLRVGAEVKVDFATTGNGQSLPVFRLRGA